MSVPEQVCTPRGNSSWIDTQEGWTDTQNPGPWRRTSRVSSQQNHVQDQSPLYSLGGPRTCRRSCCRWLLPLAARRWNSTPCWPSPAAAGGLWRSAPCPQGGQGTSGWVGKSLSRARPPVQLRKHQQENKHKYMNN